MALKNSIKYSLMTLDELVINLDRLSRFKLPEYTFHRVFSEIVLKHLPKYSKNDFFNEDANVISKIVKEIWNKSVEKNCKVEKTNNTVYAALKKIIKNTFKNIDEKTQVFLNTELNIAPVLEKIDYNIAPLNLKFLIKANKNSENISFKELRNKYSLCFPIEKLLIVEGITEEILLPVFADRIGKNFDKNGIFILGAGGKSKSPSLYMLLKDKLKIPVVFLFDKDAKEICTVLEKNLLKKDKCILIERGEFEDILPANLIKRSLNNEYQPATLLNIQELHQSEKMSDNIEAFYRTRHLGEFKKSKFAKIIAGNIKYETDITEDIKKIILNITNNR